MYAVIRAGGKQYRVAPGDVIRVEKVATGTDGHVEFCTGRYYQGDDIFLNKQGKVAAGLNAKDFVLGYYKSRPDSEAGGSD